MRLFSFHSQLCLPHKIDDIFAFFSDAANLEKLTPPWLHFHVLSPTPISMQEGTVIDYTLKLRGLPLRWQSKITAWEPPYRFVDEQTRGPYRVWIHEHRFTEKDGGTLIEDSVQYAMLGGWLADKLLVRQDLKRIFAYRSECLKEIFD